MYITRIQYGKDLDLMTIFVAGKLGTQDLLNAVIFQNADEIAAVFGPEQVNVPEFRQHMLENTVFYDIKKMDSPATTQEEVQLWIQWWTTDNVKVDLCSENIVKFPAGSVINVDTIIAKVRTEFPELITAPDGSLKKVYVSNYKIFKLQ